MPKASSLEARIKQSFPEAQVALIKGGRGDFIVTANDQSLWNKRQMGDQFPEESVIIDGLKKL